MSIGFESEQRGCAFAKDAPPGAILRLKGGVPGHVFEWHPGKRIVYVIRMGAKPLIGEAMAHDVETHGGAIMAALIWARGYRAARAERALGSVPQVVM